MAKQTYAQEHRINKYGEGIASRWPKPEGSVNSYITPESLGDNLVDDPFKLAATIERLVKYGPQYQAIVERLTDIDQWPPEGIPFEYTYQGLVAAWFKLYCYQWGPPVPGTAGWPYPVDSADKLPINQDASHRYLYTDGLEGFGSLLEQIQHPDISERWRAPYPDGTFIRPLWPGQICTMYFGEDTYSGDPTHPTFTGTTVVSEPIHVNQPFAPGTALECDQGANILQMAILDLLWKRCPQPTHLGTDELPVVGSLDATGDALIAEYVRRCAGRAVYMMRFVQYLLEWEKFYQLDEGGKAGLLGGQRGRTNEPNPPTDGPPPRMIVPPAEGADWLTNLDNAWSIASDISDVINKVCDAILELL